MSFVHLPKMLASETEGWSDIAQSHPAAKRLLFCLVMPMSLIPPLMYAYSTLDIQRQQGGNRERRNIHTNA